MNGGAASDRRGRISSSMADVRLRRLAAWGTPEAERLRRQIEELSRVKDPSVVETIGAEVRDGQLFAVVEWVGAEDLGGQLRSGLRFSAEEILRVAEGVGRALRAAHRYGFVHQDLRPASIFYKEGGEVKLGDLGPLAPRRSAHAGAADAGYLSPEQGLGRPIDIRSNLYSTGAILYELATGRPPFEGYDSTTSLLYQLAHVDALPPRQAGALIPKELERVILRCLAKAPGDRYGDPKDFLQALRHVRSSLSSERLATVKPDENAGDFDVYEDQVIGEGGMGTLLRGRQRALDRPVAVKLMREAFTTHPDFVQRFLREAEILARVDHPNVVRVIGTGVWHGRLFYAMELVRGEDLAARQRRRHRFSLDEILDIGEGVAAALKATWSYRIIHRDIKPSNIMLTEDGQVKVADFGLAKSLRDPTSETHVLAGTPDYLSPEQGLGQVVDIRSDLYSLGVVLYELAADKHPFKRVQSSVAMIYQHVHCDPAPLAALGDRVPRGLRDIIHRCLAKRPGARFQNPDELLAALRALRAEFHAPRPPAAPLRVRPRPRLLGALAAVAALALAGGAWWAAGGTRGAAGSDAFRRSYELALGLGDYDEALRLAQAGKGKGSPEYAEALERSRGRFLQLRERTAREAVDRRDWRAAEEAYGEMEDVAPPERKAEIAAARSFCRDLAAALEHERAGRWEKALQIYRRHRQTSPVQQPYLDEALRRVRAGLESPR